VLEVPAQIDASPVTPALPKPSDLYGPGTTHAGWVKHLRRTPRTLPLLKGKEAWTDGHVRLNGTLLSVHGSAEVAGAEVELIDVKDFAIACRSTSFGSDDADSEDGLCWGAGGTASRFAVALRALRGGANSPRKEAGKDAPYTFHLVPCRGAAASATGVRGALLRDGKARKHHFAVGSIEERIDWMREVMLAKAIRQKGEGFDVVVDGVRM